jgi:futalosine hydrolase
MNVLLVAATDLEMKQASKHLSATKHTLNRPSKRVYIEQLVTGIGITQTTFHLTKKLLGESYDLVMNIGICGAFDTTLSLGQVVRIYRDRFSDWGLDNGLEFTDVFDLGLELSMNEPFDKGWIYDAPPLNAISCHHLKSVSGFTVNTIRTITPERSDPTLYADTESMEGAAFLYVCRKMKMPCLQIRAVSNYVGDRDKSRWDVDGAVKNLNVVLSELF